MTHLSSKSMLAQYPAPEPRTRSKKHCHQNWTQTTNITDDLVSFKNKINVVSLYLGLQTATITCTLLPLFETAWLKRDLRPRSVFFQAGKHWWCIHEHWDEAFKLQVLLFSIRRISWQPPLYDQRCSVVIYYQFVLYLDLEMKRWAQALGINRC